MFENAIQNLTKTETHEERSKYATESLYTSSFQTYFGKKVRTTNLTPNLINITIFK